VDKKGWCRVCLGLALAVPAAVTWGCDDGGNPDASGDDGGGDADVGDHTPGEYVAPPYGVTVGSTIDDLHFAGIGGGDTWLSDFYADFAVKLLWIYAGAGWCTACGPESGRLPALWTAYNPQGLQILGVVFQDGSGMPATVAYASGYADRYAWNFPAVADVPFVLQAYFDPGRAPLNMLVDLTDMRILELEVGWDEAGFTSLVESHLASIADRGL
jgi:hypothetical protein